MSLLVILLLIYFTICKKYPNILFLFIFLNIAIPHNNRLEAFLGLNWIIETNHVILMYMLVLLFIWMRSKIVSNKLEFSFIIITLGVMFIGLLQGKDNIYLVYDIDKFLTFLVSLFVVIKWVKVLNIEISKLIYSFVISGVVYSLISITIYLFINGDFLAYLYGDIYGSIWENRVTFSNNTAQYVLVFISIYLILIKSNVILNLGALVLNIISLLIAQNRTLIIILAFMIIVLFIFFFLYNIFSKKMTNLKLSGLFFTLSLFVFITILLLQTSHLLESALISDLLNRFTEGTGTLTYREITNEYAINSIENLYIGNGIGEELRSGGYLPISFSVSLVDNLYVSIFVKLGLMGVILLILNILYVYSLIFKAYFQSKDNLYVIMILIFPGFLLNSTFMTSQLLHSSPVYLVFFLIIILSLQINKLGQLSNTMK